MDVASELIAWHRDARRRTLELVSDLDDSQVMGPRLEIVNPMRWEVGHVAWFQEYWTLRHARGESPIRTDGDSLYDSFRIPHDTRWDLPLPSMSETLAYAEAIFERVLARLSSNEPNPEEVYFHRLTVFHEDMHDEAFTYTRQTLAYPRPRFVDARVPTGTGRVQGDVEVAGGRFLLGATKDLPFVFDNEKWAHGVDVAPFAIARAPVTNREFAAFVEDGGYLRENLWSAEGWMWKERVSAVHPVYWRRGEGERWERRDFNRWVPLEPDHPVIHVSWYEAEAYGRWAGRRLPTEVEWEMAASTDGEGPSERKRRYPWGDEPPTAEHAHLEGRTSGCVDVGAFPRGDSAVGCRQMIGNVWEWTASDFRPFPGFVVDPYREYSEPWFGTHTVLRGGSWATPARLLRNTWRNFYTRDRRDVFAGFRTCAR